MKKSELRWMSFRSKSEMEDDTSLLSFEVVTIETQSRERLPRRHTHDIRERQATRAID